MRNVPRPEITTKRETCAQGVPGGVMALMPTASPTKISPFFQMTEKLEMLTNFFALSRPNLFFVCVFCVKHTRD